MRVRVTIVSFVIAIVFTLQPTFAEPVDAKTNSPAIENMKDELHKLKIIGLIKGQLIDRKDIKARYVRIRYDGSTVYLAGFVPSKQAATTIDEISAKTAKTDKIDANWLVVEDLQDEEPYKTHVAEQTTDVAIWIKVKSVLASMDVKSLLAGADVQVIDVCHGRVTLYLIADAPPATFDLDSNLKNIPGVVSSKAIVLKTY